ncbi:MAG: hypothetical protein AB7O62_04275 [Pirellulales bacterium]
MKLNGETIKSFFLHHGEKLVFAAVAAVLVGGGYALVTHESYQKTPQSLVQASESARKYVQEVTWDAAREQVVVVDPNKAIDNDRPKLDPKDWILVTAPTSGGETIGKARPQPELLAPIELEVTYGFGPIALMPKEKKGGKGRGPGQLRPGAAGPGRGGSGKKGTAGVDVPANSDISGYHYVCLRAVVPAKDQSTAFARAFLGARFTDPKTDEVRYENFVVERAKVDPDDPAKLDWQPIKTVEVSKVERWPKTAREVVPYEALDEKLTSPLPPLLTRDWGFEVAHSRWPIMQDESQLDEEEAEEEDAEDEDEDEDEEDMDDEEDEPAAAAPRRPRGGGRGAGGGGPGMAGGPAGMAGPGMRNTGTPHGTGHAADEDFLFRFFDFTVKPKEHYVYRIALKLANPNYGLHRRHLEDPDLAKDRLITGPASGPSRTIEIPSEMYFRAAEAKPARGSNEPYIKAMVVVLDNDLGILVSHKQDKVVRGQVLDFAKELKSVENPKTGEWEEKEYDFTSGAVLVDMRGGSPLPIPGRGRSKVSEPGEGLFLDKNGVLVTHGELLEAPEFAEFGAAVDEDDTSERPGALGTPGGAEMPNAPGAPLNPFDEVNTKAPTRGNR